MIVNELNLLIMYYQRKFKIKCIQKKQKKKSHKKSVFRGGRTQANCVAVQSPTNDLLTPCLPES
jgi:hypothetical protein